MSPDPILPFNFGPVRGVALPHTHGTPAEPQVRAWLATVLGADAEALRLSRDAYGRPSLVRASDGAHAEADALDLNWSHSGDRLLVALALGTRVGIDLERLRPRPRAQALAARFFTREESDWLQALPDDAREAVFTRVWCAKEAVLKAHGRGLAFGLDRLRFEENGGALRLAACDPALGDARDWTLREWQPADGYVAAVAWRAHA